MRLDAAAISETIAHALAAGGVVATWEALLRPVLAGIGERHAATAGLIEVEHLVSRCVSEAFAAVSRANARHRPRPDPALLRRRGAAQPAAGGAGRRARRGRGQLPDAGRPGAGGRPASRRSPGPDRPPWCSGRTPGPPPTRPSSPRCSPRLAGRCWSLAAGPGWRADTLPAGVVRPVDLAEAVSLAVAVRDSLDQSTGCLTGTGRPSAASTTVGASAYPDPRERTDASPRRPGGRPRPGAGPVRLRSAATAPSMPPAGPQPVESTTPRHPDAQPVAEPRPHQAAEASAATAAGQAPRRPAAHHRRTRRSR